MDYPCVKFGDCSFRRFGFIVQTNKQTDRHIDRITHTHTHTNATKCLTPVAVVGMCNDCVRGSGPAYFSFTDVCIPVADISSRSNLCSAQHGDTVVPSLSTSAQHPSVEYNSELGCKPIS